MKWRVGENKWAVCDVNFEPFQICESFVFWIISSLNNLHSNMKIWENMKNDSMQIKMNQFDFCEAHFHKTYFNCVWTLA